jgi:hypothetical protein
MAGGILLVATMTALLPCHADEGMWLFSHPPRKLLQQRHQFEPTQDWLDHLREAAVRFNSGGSGSFVSADGLVLTNHHVGADALQKLSSAEHNYLTDGFYARTAAEEIKCVDLELNVLKSIVDVTARVTAAVKPGMKPAEAEQARRGVMNTIEEESLEATGLRSDVVTLYRGGAYHLYRYKKYTDVRLVFAPEQAIAFFGGDPDNFEFPRYDLDICFFRVYEEDKPARIEHYLTWSRSGAREGELVFVAGNPGRTDRENTVAHLEFMRDRTFPAGLNLIRRREVLLGTFGQRSLENARRAQDELFGYENSRKARLGGLAGLQDPAILGRKREEEAALRKAVSAEPKLKQASSAWDEVEATLRTFAEIYTEYSLYEQATAFNSELFNKARTVVRMVAETSKPNADRLREYRQSNLESLEQELYSEAPIYEDLEIVKLADSLGMLMEMAGAEDPLVQQVLDGRSPRERAAQLVMGTRLKVVTVRKQLASGGQAGLAASNDPLIALAQLVDAPARRLRKKYEEDVEEPQRQAYARLANARFALTGADTYPDATFTLRLAFGVVKGYQEQGRPIPAMTTVGGAYEHSTAHNGQPPFNLPPTWLENKDRLKLDTPFNFVSTADIIGGNSGSPVVNRAGEFVGIIFDGNIQSLVLDFVYTDEQARAVSVHSSGILEALRNVYQAERLVAELSKGGHAE